MKKLLSFIAIFMLFATINTNATNVISTEVNNECELLIEDELLRRGSCFSFLHQLWTELYGGITLENVGEFNAAVAYCQAALE